MDLIFITLITVEIKTHDILYHLFIVHSSVMTRAAAAVAVARRNQRAM